jgi:hypothetical protein
MSGYVMSKVFCDVCFKVEFGHENDLSVMRRRLAEQLGWGYSDDTGGISPPQDLCPDCRYAMVKSACDALDRVFDPTRRGTS